MRSSPFVSFFFSRPPQARPTKNRRKGAAPWQWMREGSFDAMENEEEVFAVLCIYSQLLFMGLAWCWQPF